MIRYIKKKTTLNQIYRKKLKIRYGNLLTHMMLHLHVLIRIHQFCTFDI